MVNDPTADNERKTRPTHRFIPPAVNRLTGEEQIVGTEQCVSDFWSWAYSDHRGNTVRPMLAEFLVATALGTNKESRIEWAAHDVDIPGGGWVEVKSAAYLQAWPQDNLSKIQFGGLRSRVWTEDSGLSAEITFNADVYVFAVLDGKTHDDYNALDTGLWRFWALHSKIIRGAAQNSMNLASVERLGATPVGFSDLRDAILQVWRLHNSGT